MFCPPRLSQKQCPVSCPTAEPPRTEGIQVGVAPGEAARAVRLQLLALGWGAGCSWAGHRLP